MINHDMLMKNRKFTGISNYAIYFSKSYLSEQSFRVNLEYFYSNPSNITCGVTEGSNFGIFAVSHIRE